MILVLNAQRQVVYANSAAAELMHVDDTTSLMGQRPGEQLGCEHAFENAGGCGTTKHCSACGVVPSIMDSLAGHRSVNECHLNRAGMEDSFDLRVWGTPLEANGEGYSIFAIRDIADEKRRKALERTFFHDIINTAGGLLGYAELMQMSSPEELEALDVKTVMPALANPLMEEIASQRTLTQAETGAVALAPVDIDVAELLEATAAGYRQHEVAHDRKLVVIADAMAGKVHSDRTLLARVLGNMTKNALEASGPGEAVTLSAHALGDDVELRVHNPSVMPAKVQLQVFQRSFSTKGSGRGIGTFSIKLFTERYLKGQVDFESKDGLGTTFWVRIPRSP